jgi:hypothetical protein
MRLRHASLWVMPLVFIALAFVGAKPLRIAWYKYQARASWDRAVRMPPSGRQHELLEEHAYYRDALVQMGYLTKRVFTLKCISVPSEDSREFWKLIERRFPENIYVRLTGYETNTLDQLTVWDTKDRMQEWERFVTEYDCAEFQKKIMAK